MSSPMRVTVSAARLVGLVVAGLAARQGLAKDEITRMNVCGASGCRTVERSVPIRVPLLLHEVVKGLGPYPAPVSWNRISIASRTAACAVPGDWPHTRDADWVVRVLHRAGFETHGCTGSAFTIDLGRADLYVWAFSRPRIALEPGMTTRVVAGVWVHVNRIRATWRAGRRNVWIEAGPTTDKLPPPARWRRLVAAILVR